MLFLCQALPSSPLSQSLQQLFLVLLQSQKMYSKYDAFFRMEFKAYTDVKPVKPIKAKSQYKLSMEEKANLETSYNATYKGEQSKPEAADNKLLDRRRIRSLYNEPSMKESSKVCK